VNRPNFEEFKKKALANPEVRQEYEALSTKSHRNRQPIESLETLKTQLTALKPALQRDYHITELGIFGSYARGEQTEDSDIDIFVEFDPSFSFGLFTFCYIESDLSDTLGKQVDLVMKEGLNPALANKSCKKLSTYDPAGYQRLPARYFGSHCDRRKVCRRDDF
jgi:uncharacterized protein